MSDYNAIIDKAILAHNAWVNRFYLLLKHEDAAGHEFDKVGDQKSCALGQWLVTNEPGEVLPSDLLTELTMLHVVFHAIADEIAGSLRQKATAMEVLEKLDELDAVSQKLMALLASAKQ